MSSLVVLVGTLGQLNGIFSVAGTRSVVLYASILTLPCGLIFCAACGWAIDSAAKYAAPNNTNRLAAGAGTSIAATVIGLFAVVFSCAAGAASSGSGSEAIKSPTRRPDSATKLALSPAAQPDTPAGTLSLRLQ